MTVFAIIGVSLYVLGVAFGLLLTFGLWVHVHCDSFKSKVTFWGIWTPIVFTWPISIPLLCTVDGVMRFFGKRLF